MKIFVSILFGILILVGSIQGVNAADSVNMSVTVVERKSTDTINDFRFESIDGQPQVLGISTERNDQICLKKETSDLSASLWQKITNIFGL